MRAFFSFLIKSIIFTTAGSFFLYVIVFFLLSPRSPKDAAEVMHMVSELPNVRENFQKMLSRNYEAVTHINVDEDVAVGSPAPPEPPTNSAPNDLTERITALESHEKDISDLKRDVERLQEQLDRLENENRALTLKLEEAVKSRTR